MARAEVDKQLNHLFRREAGRMVAILTRIFGSDHIDLAENVVQDALLKVMQVWPAQGIPDNPSGWIMTVAKNKALDVIKKRRELQVEPELLDVISDEGDEGNVKTTFENEVHDNQLRLMFICCHPVIPHEARVALTLKTVCGFGVSEIARAFLAKDEAISQKLVRAKQKIKDAKLPFELPATSELEERLSSVLDTVYLLFNEGYAASHGDWLVRDDLCGEACRLGRLIADHSQLTRPKANALVALMFFQSSRLSARLDANGDVLLLEDQDRSLWDQERIAVGLDYLQRAAAGNELSAFHLLAGIAACHASAETFAKTDWERILSYYDHLCEVAPTPIVALNRAVAVSFVKGPKAGLRDLSKLKSDPRIKGYYLFPATTADLYRRLDQYVNALALYEEAFSLVATAPERRFLQRRIDECKSKVP